MIGGNKPLTGRRGEVLRKLYLSEGINNQNLFNFGLGGGCGASAAGKRTMQKGGRPTGCHHAFYWAPRPLQGYLYSNWGKATSGGPVDQIKKRKENVFLAVNLGGGAS